MAKDTIAIENMDGCSGEDNESRSQAQLNSIVDKYRELNATILCPSAECKASIDAELRMLQSRNASLTKQISCAGHAYDGSLFDLLGPVVLPPGDLITFLHSCSLLICDLVEGSGLLRQGILRDVGHALQRMTEHQGEVKSPLSIRTVPHSMGIVLGLLQCEELLHHHRVQEDTTNGIDVSSEVNKYASTVVQELDLAALLHQKVYQDADGSNYGSCHMPVMLLSEPKETVGINLSSLREGFISEVCSLLPNKVVMSTTERLAAHSAGIVHGISIWYNMYMDEASDSDCLCTGPDLSNPHHNSHYRQAAFLLQEPVSVCAGDVIEIEMTVESVGGILCRIR